MNKKLIIIFAVWLAALLLVGAISPSFSIYGDKKCGNKFDPPYYRWDSAWYTGIAQHGYYFSDVKNSPAAFFPLYPATIRIFYKLFSARPGIVGFYLSIIYAFLAMMMIYRLVKLDYPEKASMNIVLGWLFFPAAFFLVAVYPEALFILLLAASLYLARKKKWLWAGIVGAFLALTKPYGVLLVPTLLWEYWESFDYDKKIFFKKFDWIPLTFPGFSLIGFMIFNYFKMGSPIAFMLAQKTWGRENGNPLVALWEEFRHNLFAGHIAGWNMPYYIYIVSLIFSIWAFYVSFSRVRKSYLLFSFLVLLVAISTGTLTSWHRYMFMAFPVIIGPIVYFSEKKNLIYLYLAASLAIMLTLASLFVRCYYVV